MRPGPGNANASIVCSAAATAAAATTAALMPAAAKQAHTVCVASPRLPRSRRPREGPPF